MASLRDTYQRVRKIMVKGTNWVGDTLMSFPALHSLRELLPQAHISVLVKSRLAELWNANPDIDEVIPYTMPTGTGRIFGELQVARLIKQKKIDLAIIFPRSFSSAWMVFLGGAAHRIGYKGEARDWLLTERIDRTPTLLRNHRMYYYLHLIERVGHCSSFPLPSLSLNGKTAEWANGFLSHNGLQETVLIGFNPGATYGEAKCWPPERFVALGKSLRDDFGAFILVFGSAHPKEKELNATIAQGIGEGCLDLSGRTSLLELAALLEQCRMLVTNDTGTMHVAAAVGTRVVAIFGPTDPRTTAPLGEGHTIVRRAMPCSPCLKRVCPEGHHACMRQIPVSEVLTAVDASLFDGKNEQK
jgi:heptosyltransferase-2